MVAHSTIIDLMYSEWFVYQIHSVSVLIKYLIIYKLQVDI